MFQFIPLSEILLPIQNLNKNDKKWTYIFGNIFVNFNNWEERFSILPQLYPNLLRSTSPNLGNPSNNNSLYKSTIFIPCSPTI